MKGDFKKLLCLFFKMMLILLVAVIPASIVQASAMRVTFTNTRTDKTSLYVTKKVDTAGNGYVAPEDDIFTFYVKLDGAVVKESEYHLLDRTGKEVFNYNGTLTTTKDETKIPTPFLTDRKGKFTLKADQTARFDDLYSGMSYEVTEAKKDGYIQSYPAGGAAAVGTITEEGAAIQFRNTYLPEIEAETTSLVVKKNIAFPSGYELPETPDFTFSVKVKNKPWMNESYVVRDNNTNDIVDAGRTDGDGKFHIKGGQYAVFSEVPSGADYEVSEETVDGWRLIESTGTTGATQAPTTYVTFTNSEASFGVSKRAEGLDGQSFKFTLRKEDQTGFANAEYYLYNLSGKKIGAGATDGIGRFTLNVGEVAIFHGIDPGVKYSVIEEAGKGYQIATGNYTDKVVSDSIEVLPFINKAVEDTALTVTKNVSYEVPIDSSNIEFEFKMTLDGEPAAGLTYSIERGNNTSTYSTDENGVFKLKENETAKFDRLKTGDVYKIEEINVPEGFYPPNPKEGEGGDALVFENVYGVDKAKMTLTKVDSRTKDPIKGVVFGIYQGAAEVGEIVTDENGIGLSEFLPYGTYTVKEKLPAADYELSDTEYTVVLDGTEEVVNVSSKPIENKKANAFGKIGLTKVDADIPGKPLNGAVFGIYLDEYCVNEVGEMITDEEGKAVSEDLPLGDYYVQEKAAPDGYIISTEIYPVSIVDSDEIVEMPTITNTYANGSIKIVKFGEGNKILPGVTFELKDEDGNVTAKTTDSSGELVFEGLKAGTYEITETETVPGYSLLGDKITAQLPVVVSNPEDTTNATYFADGKYYFFDVTYHVSNSVNMSMPASGSSGMPYMLLVVGVGCVLFGVVKKKKKDSAE